MLMMAVHIIHLLKGRMDYRFKKNMKEEDSIMYARAERCAEIRRRM
jgi:hypothetical protein